MKLLFTLLSCAFVLTWLPKKRPETVLADPADAQAVLDEVNALRAKGCQCPGGKRFRPAPALQLDSLLEKVAQRHADDMQQNRFFSHDSEDGTIFSRRITRAGYHWQVVGENIAMGYPTPEAVVKAWRTSRDHCPNLMNPEFRDMGIGKAGPYWVQDLGARME